MKKSSESGEKYAQIKNHLQVKQSKTFLNKYCILVDFDVREQQGKDFFFSLEEVLLWKMDTYLGQKQQLKKV